MNDSATSSQRALRLFRRRGCDAKTVEQICEAADVSTLDQIEAGLPL